MSVAPGDRARWERALSGVTMALIGETVTAPVITVSAAGRELASVGVEDVRQAWTGEGRASP